VARRALQSIEVHVIEATVIQPANLISVPMSSLKHLLSYEDAWYDAFASYNLSVNQNDKTKRDYKKIVELKRKAEELYKGLVQLSSKGVLVSSCSCSRGSSGRIE
jgi:hypothetical protein